ncbi:3-((3aS,4S,7aS)-7a-methyl-1,5-dioxo-octahydro-1H- inden-4-yl)propanoate--CoA ligase FadD3 [Pseudonocardia eucalypti]|uniref:3-((3aS,4S,7aS)-7a-methyl-1, 5-dioxo-octahydro-1H- inden-4-yl)propanoate--CoA ligase FadD3 n=1 Tax=Pseudonocardia eucalypti TaxID=648755 RepID=A0ABP9QYV8_9PSEU|nr:acyl-CoA synthetase (AMP-forming)/AMP-acid ligase II [Pseudonocardia eucalypti]
MQTVPTALAHAADQWPDAEALVDGNLRLTWSELADRVQVMSRYLLAKGVRSGDRVAIHDSNRWQWVVGALGTLSVGATLVPVNTRLAPPEVADILERTGPALVVRELDWAEVAGVAAGVPAADAVAAGRAVRPEQVSDILFTSGTTGRSKGAMSAQAQALGVAAAWAERAELTLTDRYLVINPFSHSFGYKAGILACLLTGATILPMAVFNADEAMELIERERVTVLPGAPTLYRSLLDAPKRSGYDLSSLRIAVTGATTVPVALIEEMRAELTFDTVLTAYGLTEAVVATMCEPGDDADTVSHTCGHPAAGFELRIDGTGEVLLRGPNVMLGYLDESSVGGTSIGTDPSATAAAVDADGWLHTGDIGRLDERGYLTITDRLKDMYICGGFNVYPAEVEQALARLAGVAEAAVIGVPDGRMGEVGRAYVVPRPGATLHAEDVVGHCKERLAGYKVPRQVEFRGELPRNASGKVLKTELRAEASR